MARSERHGLEKVQHRGPTSGAGSDGLERVQHCDPTSGAGSSRLSSLCSPGSENAGQVITRKGERTLDFIVVDIQLDELKCGRRIA